MNEENEAKVTHKFAIKNEPPEDDKKMVFIKKEFDEDDIEIIQEIPGKSNYLQIEIIQEIPGKSNNLQISLKKEIKEEIEMKKEPVQCEDNKENIKKVEIKEELIKKEPDENEEDCYKEIILKALDLVVAIPGGFACGGILAKTKLQLSVKGVGNIKLPLSFDQADVLKTKCTAAPFGRGTETLVHKSVRDAWQVDAEDVIVNEEFNILIKEKMAEIIPHLSGESITEDIRQSITKHHKVELYKLVYYEKGGHFVAHRDTEKAPGMFATLVIQLPAGHKGGALEINHKGYTEVFDHENDSRNNFFFTAFFADCEHELKKITAGHRLVLIYNIIRKDPHSTIHTNNDINSSKNKKFSTTLKKAVKKWKSDNNGPNYLALKLDFLYTDKNISFQNLKGKDKKISDALCSSADIEVYLATITKNETRHGDSYKQNRYDSYKRYRSYNSDGSEDDSMSDKESSDDSMSDDESLRDCFYTLTNWMGVNNNMKNYGEQTLDEKEMLIDEEDMFQENYELHKSAIEYTGNEGSTQEYTYKKKAIVICPKSYAFLLACKEDFTSVIVELKKMSEQGDAWENAWEMLSGIMDYIMRPDSNGRAMIQLKKNDNVASIFDLLRLFENNIKSANFFLKAFLDIGLPTANSGVALANLINKLSWESLGANVLQLVKMRAASHTLGFAQLVSSMLLLGLQEQAVKVVEVGTPQIIARKDSMSSDNLAHWLSLLASYDILSTHFYNFFQQILNMKDDIMIEIIAEMHSSLQLKVISQNRIIECFESILNDLQDKDWKNLSPKSVTLVIPVLVFVDKNESLNSFVQAIIAHENSCIFLEPILKLPIVIIEKDNPSVQLLVQTRLRQLEKIQPPVFSWAQPNATLVNRPTHDRGPHSGPLSRNIHNFLRSDVESKTFGRFENIKHARRFGWKYFSNGNYNEAGHYSATFAESGRGTGAQCTIIKTMSVFDEQVKRYTILCTEAKVLRKKFCEPKKTVAMKRALE